MAKSIREQIKTGKIDINHGGQEKTFSLPDWLTKLENIDSLEDFYKLSTDIQIGLFHQGIAQVLVQLRAKARVFKDGKPVPMNLPTIQGKILSYTPPKLAADKEDKKMSTAIKALMAVGMSEATAIATIEAAKNS